MQPKYHPMASGMHSRSVGWKVHSKLGARRIDGRGVFLNFNGCGCCLKPIFTMELTLISFLCDSTCSCHAKVWKYVFLPQREVDFQGFWIWRNYLGSAIFCRRPCIQRRYSSAARNFFGLVVPRLNVTYISHILNEEETHNVTYILHILNEEGTHNVTFISHILYEEGTHNVTFISHIWHLLIDMNIM